MAKIFNRQFGNRVRKAVSWLLLMLILGNLLNVTVAPKKARAADPHMLLFWDTALNAGPPAGWSFVDDGGTEAFYNGGGTNNVFPRGEATFGRLAGGAYNHTHTGTPTSPSGNTVGGTSRSATNSPGTVTPLTHNHPVSGSASLTTTDNRPVYRNLRVIQYDSGIPTTIPHWAIAVFDAAAVPAGWTSYSATQGTNYVAALNVSGGTGGNNTHAGAGHTVTGLNLDNNTSTSTISGTTANRNTAVHGHTACSSTNVTNFPSSEPPYVNVLLGYASADTSVTTGMIAMFDGSIAGPSYGWQVLSNAGGPFYQKFLKSAASYSAGAGADPTHSHTNVSCTSSSVTGATAGGSGTAGYGISGSHTHTTTVAINAATGSTLPTYTNVIFARKSYDFTTLTTDSAVYDTSGTTINIDATVTNNSASNIVGSSIDYVIFVDGDADNVPDAGETYVYTSGGACDSSGVFGTDGPGYTFRKSALDVNASGGTGTDTQSCANTSFPQHTNYVLYGKWYNSTVYATNYVGFHSVPTLTGMLFMALVGGAVFLGVRTGAIRIRVKNPDDEPSDRPNSHHGSETQRSNDGVAYISGDKK